MIIALLASLSSPAHAIDLKWWGVGPTISTMAIPADYPFSLPVNVRGDESGEGDDLVSKVRGDVEIGAHGVIYPSAAARLGARAILGFGTNGWNRQEFTLEYAPALIKEQGFQLLFGGGIGAGTEMYPSVAENDRAFLRANYFPIRAQVTAMLRDKRRAYEIGLFGTFHIVADQNYYDEPGDTSPHPGNEGATKVAGLEGLAGASYFGIGGEATVYFGDFRGKQDGGGGGGRRNKRRGGG